MRRVVLRVREDAVEGVCDVLLVRLPDGVHERPAANGLRELVAHGVTASLPPLAELRELLGQELLDAEEHEVPESWHERRQLDGSGGIEVAGRFWLRSPLDPAPRIGLLDIVIGRGAAFGSGAHPTTRMCLAVLVELAAGGGSPQLREAAFADLGCGAGALAIAAAKLGFAPVAAVDVDGQSVTAAVENAERNGVTIAASVLDLVTQPPPRARVVAANVPPHVHACVAPRLSGTELVIASGMRAEAADDVVAAYAAAGLTLRERREADGWLVLALERSE